ncbi:MAG TPA: hypothetical protein VMY69_00660 [Phycisphaerae bacterium]|nr:hypothetical protein [Phycisphaerae bacterium]
MAGLDYYSATHTVTAGSPTPTTISLIAEIAARTRRADRFLQIRSDKDLEVQFNDSTADTIVIDVSVNPELTIQNAPMHFETIYLSTVGGCGSGDATVQVVVI